MGHFGKYWPFYSLAIVVILAGLFWYFKIRKVQAEPKIFTIADAEAAIKYLADKKGVERARLIEQIMRLETAHFTSGQYQKTGSAGMEVGKWKDIPLEATAGEVVMSDSNKVDGDDHFIVWRSVKDFALYLSDYIDRYSGNYARWYSTDPSAQAYYRSKVESIKPKFV